MKLIRIKETIGLEESGCNINLDNAIFITPELQELADKDEPMKVDLGYMCSRCNSTNTKDELGDLNNYCGNCGQRICE